MEGHGIEKFRDASLLATSASRPWSSLSAELRKHQGGEIAAFSPTCAEITMIVRKGGDATTSRASGGIRQTAPAEPGTVWLCPSGICEEATRLSGDIPEVLHVYLPHHLFQKVEVAEGPNLSGRDVRYEVTSQDIRLTELLQGVVMELNGESFAGGLRADQIANDLLAHLAAHHSETGTKKRYAQARGGLDRRRLSRVTEYIEANLLEDLTLHELAEVAGFSVFHFARAFARSFGLPPHSYLARRRLDVAKSLLAFSRVSIADVSDICRFSTQSNFTKAFQRSTGTSPGRYRRAAIG